MFPSNLRFGHFEYAFHFGFHNELNELIEYTQKTFFPQIKNIPEMLEQIVTSTAKLIAKWQTLGFCHGVMNSDNMSILGITIDYGPFGFMENFKEEWICNHSDPRGRYSYQNQPAVALWNLDRLLMCFSKIIERPILQSIFNHFDVVYAEYWEKEFCEKFGIENSKTGDVDLILEFLKLMQKYSMDFTHTFRSLPDAWKILPAGWQGEDLISWRSKYIERLKSSGPLTQERKEKLLRKNPKFVLRNYIAQEIIEEVEQGRNEKLNSWMKVFESPFDEHPDFHEYSLPTPEAKRNIEVSCSS